VIPKKVILTFFEESCHFLCIKRNKMICPVCDEERTNIYRHLVIKHKLTTGEERRLALKPLRMKKLLEIPKHLEVSLTIYIY